MIYFQYQIKRLHQKQIIIIKIEFNENSKDLPNIIYRLLLFFCNSQILINLFFQLIIKLSLSQDKISRSDSDDNQRIDKTNLIFDRIKNFWWAYEAISSKESSLILKGIEQAIQFQKALVNEAKFALDRDLITHCSDFRFIRLNNDSYAQNQYFLHPYSLQKLALFLMEIFKEKQKSNQYIKPMVLCIKNSLIQHFTIIGVVGNNYSSHTKNDFANKFQSAANTLNLECIQDDFETSIIEIKEKDFQVFVDEITLSK